MAQAIGIKAGGARKRKSKKGGKGSSWVPEVIQAFVARRLVDICAGLLFFGGLVLFVALASYDHTDPSWNTSADAPGWWGAASNWMGLPGAWISDFVMQTAGVSGFLAAAVLMIWGLRVFRRQQIGWFLLRFAALIFAVFAGSIALAQIGAGDWLVHPFLGSTLGTMGLEALVPFFEPLGIGRAGLSWLAGFLCLGSFMVAADIRKIELLWAGRMLRDVLLMVLQLLYNSFVSFMDWIHRYNNDSYEPRGHALWARFGQSMREIAARFHVERRATPEQPVIQDVALPEGLMEEVAPAPSAAASSAPAQEPEGHAPIPVMTPKAGGKAKAGGQRRFVLGENENWEFPALDMLEDVPANAKAGQLDKAALQRNAELLQSVLADFGVQGEITAIYPGPVVTLYELEPAPGVKSQRVISLSDDIARSMSAVSVRCAVVPGRNVIGIELPNKTRQTVYMREVLASKEAQKSSAKLPLVLGKDIGGQPIIADLAKMPHLLVAGTTGSGKSVAVNTMILSILYNLSPEQCRFIMIDPKMLELSVYDDIPHLLSPVVTEPGKAVVSLKWAVNEMEERYRAMSKLGVRNVEGYNKRVSEAAKKGEVIMNRVQTGFDSGTGEGVYEDVPMDLTPFPYIVIVVDEFADLMLVAGKDVESAIQRLAQMARAAGIHLIMATQRPSVDVITGVVKANFPTRISFQVTSKIDSRTILGEGGAEQLLGMGDMLYMAPGGRITRVHGPFVSDGDVENVVEHLKAQGEPAYLNEVTEGGEFGESEVMNAMFGEGGGAAGGSSSVDELYDEAVAIVSRERKASTSFIQRYLQIGYNRAARIIEEMEKQGVVSPATATGKREVLVGDHSGQ